MSRRGRRLTPHGRGLPPGATFHPRGLKGQLYWWGVAPFHGIVFGGMLRNIHRAAEADTAAVRGASAAVEQAHDRREPAA